MNELKQWDVTIYSKKDGRYYQYRSVVARSKQEAQNAVWNKVKDDDDTIQICLTVPVVEQKLGVVPA